MHEILVFSNFHIEFSFNFVKVVSELQNFFIFENTKYIFFFEIMTNALVIRSFRLFYIYDLLLSQELKDWVKAKCYEHHFHMMNGVHSYECSFMIHS